MRCPWFALVPFAVAAAVLAASAQPSPQPKDGKLILPITVSPAAVPVPALKYHLLPELRDCQTGNQVQAFYKCFMEQHYF